MSPLYYDSKQPFWIFWSINKSSLLTSRFDIRSNDFKPRRNNSSFRREQTLKYAGILGSLALTILLIYKWMISDLGPETRYSDEEKFSYNSKEIDYKMLEKFDEGVESFYINHQGEILDEEQIQQEIDQLYHSTIDYYDLNDYEGYSNGEEARDHLLLLVPLRNAEDVLPLMFKHVMNITYPHSLIDIAFLVSDCSEDDRTLETVFDYSIALQNGNLSQILQAKEDETKKMLKGTKDLHLLYMPEDYLERVNNAFDPENQHKNYNDPFRSIQIFKKDFGQVIGQGFSDRHAVKVQGIRRKLMGRARNWLTANALKPYHSWVYWRDVDIELMPGDIIQSMMKHNYDVIVPNVWRPLPTFLGNEQAYDLNSWMESDQGLELAKTLSEDDVIVEGYVEYPTWRVHLGYIRSPQGDPNEIVDLDGIGGVSILAKAKVFRQGGHFPAFTFLNHAETEAFGKLCKKMGFSVGGLPHYTIWHIYEPSEDDLQEIARRERKKRRQRGKNN